MGGFHALFRFTGILQESMELVGRSSHRDWKCFQIYDGFVRRESWSSTIFAMIARIDIESLRRRGEKLTDVATDDHPHKNAAIQKTSRPSRR
jgi:hypothetical protein